MLEDFVGFGALGEALQSLATANYRRIFVVASVDGWRRFNSPEQRSFFVDREMELFSAFSVNPDFQEILAGSARLKAFKPDLLIAIGGGSAIDVAKVIKAEAFTKESYDPANPSGIKASGDGPPLVAIATTAGSGAEATQHGIFYVGDAKQSLSQPSMRPEIAVVDPELSYSLPPLQTAATGIDAISQAVEAYWADAATPETQEWAKAAIAYAVPNLYNAVHEPAPGNRYNMAQAAYLAGKAINTTRTTLPHALGYHLTKRYGLPHGHAVALTLPYFFVLNLDPRLPVTASCGPEKHRKNMEDLFGLMGQKDGADAFAFWRNLMHHCGLASTFGEIGMTSREQFRELVSTVNPDRMKNHPVRIESEFLAEFFMTHA